MVRYVNTGNRQLHVMEKKYKNIRAAKVKEMINMTLEEVVQRIDKSEANREITNYEDMCDTLGLDYFYGEVPEMECYWMSHRFDGGTEIGERLYFFRGEFVAYSFQEGGALDEYIRWVNEEEAYEVRRYLSDLILESEILTVSTLPLKGELKDTYGLEWVSDLTWLNSTRALHEGDRVDIVEHMGNTTVGIQLQDGTFQTVDIKELRFQYNLI